MEHKKTIEQKVASWKHVSNENWNNWKWQIEHSLTDKDDYFEQKVVERYRFRATPYYLSLIDWDDSNDPIRRQSIPDRLELEGDEYVDDPFAEMQTASQAGFVHRYPDRVLLVATNNCAMYCRHCTRKNILYHLHQPYSAPFENALSYIATKPEVREVLISGGDPLLLNLEKLDQLLTRIHAIEHVESVRIGTRIPVVLPMRVDDELVDMLKKHKPLWINTQFNHPRELTVEATACCRKLVDAGIPVSNQSVLLKNINDDFAIMRELCVKLQRNLIRPYYVFQCDPIAGISHFRTDVKIGIALEKALRESVGGLCLPRFVADIPNQKWKTDLRETV